MAFTTPPKESRKKVNKAGKILSSGVAIPTEMKWALKLADQWRACHAYPINTFNATLRRKLKSTREDFLVAQRLKRMPTIVDKLKRHPNMQLVTMQDIGGVRAVLESVSDVYDLAAQYRDRSRFKHELKDENDYIQSPRDEDGYRSLHLIYRYKSSIAPQYDGLLIELQIRTKLQHIWATAVETMGTFLGQALKSRQGEQKWLDFFAITSSAFAHIEKTALIPRYAHMSQQETFQSVADAENGLKALDRMRGFSTAVRAIEKGRSTGERWHYHLIILNSIAKTVELKAYKRDDFKKANADYSVVEAEAAKHGKIEPVLVAAGPVEQLRRAYPNFFLDITDFSNQVQTIIGNRAA